MNSVLKFLSDLYSCRQTANLLYTNDAKVLIDIIVRQLSDLSAGNQVGLLNLLLTLHKAESNTRFNWSFDFNKQQFLTFISTGVIWSGSDHFCVKAKVVDQHSG